MEKRLITNFIKKYHLSGLIESVKWEFSNGTLFTNFLSPNRSLLGFVSVSGVDLESHEIGIYDTSKLLKMLSVLDDEISINIVTSQSKSFGMDLTSGKVGVRYMLADIDVIPKSPNLKQLPQFEASITLSSDFKDAFVSSYSALSNDSTFTFIHEDGIGKIIVGDYHNTNSDRIKIEVDSECSISDTPITFSAEHLNQILLANKEFFNYKLSIAFSGLATIDFDDGIFKSTYYLIAIQK